MARLKISRNIYLRHSRRRLVEGTRHPRPLRGVGILPFSATLRTGARVRVTLGDAGVQAANGGESRAARNSVAICRRRHR